MQHFICDIRNNTKSNFIMCSIIFRQLYSSSTPSFYPFHFLGIWALGLETWNLEFGTWNLELGTWNLELS